MSPVILDIETDALDDCKRIWSIVVRDAVEVEKVGGQDGVGDAGHGGLRG